MNLRRRIAAFCLTGSAFLLSAAPANEQKIKLIEEACQQSGAMSELIHPGPDGKLVYATDEDGNRVADFSHAGYKGGGVAIPDVKTVLEIAPSGGDDTEALQAAIDKLSELPLGDDGFRGALLMKRGKFVVTKTLFIRASGVVVRGEGAGFGGTWVYHKTVVEPGTEDAGGMVHVPQAARGIYPTFETIAKYENFMAPVSTVKLTEIDEAVVPAGSVTFRVKELGELQPGAEIMVVCRQTQAWIDALGLTEEWKDVDDFKMRMRRTVAAVDPASKTVTVDAPLGTRIDIAGGYATGEVHGIEHNPRLKQVGIEDILFLSGYDRTKKDDGGYFNDELHPNLVARFYGVQDGWLRRCTAMFYSYAFVRMGGSRNVTVEDVGMLDGVSRDTPKKHTGARKYYFDNGEKSLVQRCYARYARHAFVGNGPVEGAVFLDCYSEKDHLPSEWHQRWGYAHLYDNLCVEASIQFKGVFGGHGQTAAFSMGWNNLITNKRTFESDLVVTKRGTLCTNYGVGNILAGSGQARADLSLKSEEKIEQGWIESNGTFVTPRSLYLKQLEDRLGADAVKAVATNTQITGKPGQTWIDLIGRYGDLPEYLDPEEAPWPGWEQWVPQYETPAAKGTETAEGAAPAVPVAQPGAETGK